MVFYLTVFYRKEDAIMEKKGISLDLYRGALYENYVCMFTLANSFFYGIETARDYPKAIHWYKKVVSKRDKESREVRGKAYNFLGICYLEGFGVTANYGEAYDFFNRGGNLGCPEAICNKGYMLNNGLGVAKDLLMAKRCYRKADRLGCAEAKNNLALMYQSGQADCKSVECVIELYKAAAEKGSVNAMNNLGITYFHGIGISPDLIEAHKWFKKAKNQERPDEWYGIPFSNEDKLKVSPPEPNCFDINIVSQTVCQISA